MCCCHVHENANNVGGKLKVKVNRFVCNGILLLPMSENLEYVLVFSFRKSAEVLDVFRTC